MCKFIEIFYSTLMNTFTIMGKGYVFHSETLFTVTLQHYLEKEGKGK